MVYTHKLQQVGGVDNKAAPKFSQEENSIILNKELRVKIGERILEAFDVVKHGDKQKIAKELELEQGSVSGYIKGSSTPKIETLIKISEKTKFSIHYILTGKGSRHVINDDGIREDVGDELEFLDEDWRGAIERLSDARGTSFDEEVRALIGDGARARAAAVLGYINDETPHESDLIALEVLVDVLRKDALKRLSRPGNDKAVNSR